MAPAFGSVFGGLFGVASLAFAAEFTRAVLRKGRHQLRVSSSLSQPGRTVSVVTTAALPWRTGTSINPLLRAAHLAADPKRKVILVVPWLEADDQQLLFPDDLAFVTQHEQAEYMKDWAKERTGLACAFKVYFYSAKYFPLLGSILATEDIASLIPLDEADVALLEEPEHLNWLNRTTRWTDRFQHVVGIMHTNYLSYVSEGQATGFLNAVALDVVNKWVCRIHCHKVIKLSDAVQKLPREVTCNVHGVSGTFLDVGLRKEQEAPGPNGRRFAKGMYFLGKAVWGKGWRELLELLAEYQQSTWGGDQAPTPIEADMFGSGEDLEAIKARAIQLGLTGLNFAGGKDHADPSINDYAVFVNPSRSDVVATTTAEALSMGKWVVVEDIPCNEFFRQFPSCLMYTDATGFSEQLGLALAGDPPKLEPELLHVLSWEAATDRLLTASAISESEWPGGAEADYDKLLWAMYRSNIGLKMLNQALGVQGATGSKEGEEQQQQQQTQDEQRLDLEQVALLREGDELQQLLSHEELHLGPSRAP